MEPPSAATAAHNFPFEQALDETWAGITEYRPRAYELEGVAPGRERTITAWTARSAGAPCKCLHGDQAWNDEMLRLEHDPEVPAAVLDLFECDNGFTSEAVWQFIHSQSWDNAPAMAVLASRFMWFQEAVWPLFRKHDEELFRGTR
jgi:hypothetical protein